MIGPLSDPRQHGLDPAFAFVIPSLPGSGFSGPTPDTGWGPRRIAAAWAMLMRRLGHDRYGAVGNDWGSFTSPELGRLAPDAVVGVHVTQLFPPPDGEATHYPPTTVPPGLAHFPDDLPAIRAYAERDHADIVSWNVYDRGGHYAAHQEPELLVGDIRGFFAALRRRRH